MAKTIYATKEDVRRLWIYHHIHLDTFPNAGPNPNITRLKNKYWGKDALCGKHGQYVYHVDRKTYEALGG